MTAHDQVDIFRYLSGGLPASEKDRIEAHLKTCAECSDLLAFVRDFNSSIKAIPPEELQPDTPCPDADTIASFAANELDESSARSVRLHTIFCKECLKEVFMLRRASRAAGFISPPKSSKGSTSWRKHLKGRRRQHLLHVRLLRISEKRHGRGPLIMSVDTSTETLRIPEQGPEFRGKTVKIPELSIGENTYRLKVTVNKKGCLSCDIAGIRTPIKEPLHVSVRSESGEELASLSSDKSGNCHFLVRGAWDIKESRILTLMLKAREQHILRRASERNRSV